MSMNFVLTLWLYFISSEICLHQLYQSLAVIFSIKYMLAHKYVPVTGLTTLDKCQNIQHKDKKPPNEMNTTITIINTPKYKYNNTASMLQNRTKNFFFIFLFRDYSFSYEYVYVINILEPSKTYLIRHSKSCV